MPLFTPGPVNKDFPEGELDNWHLEVFNNSEQRSAKVTLTVFALHVQTGTLVPSPTRIGTTFVNLNPGQYSFLNIAVDTSLFEHTLPIISIPNDNFLMSLYGRNSSFRQITAATFGKNQLERISHLQGASISKFHVRYREYKRKQAKKRN